MNENIEAIRQLHRFRQDLLSAEVSLSNRIESVYRRLTGMKILERAAFERKHNAELALLRSGDEGQWQDDQIQARVVDILTPEQGEVGQAQGEDDQHVRAYLAALSTADAVTIPMVESRALVKKQRVWYEKQIEKRAKELPVYPWIEACRGVSALSLGLIVGECGDLANYPTKGTLWKRMGLAVIQGQRQRRVANDAELAIEHGYNPRRRSLAYLLADNLIRARNPEYYDWYIEEKERQREKLGEEAPQAHVHNRAHRHLSKRFLKHLWQQWRALERGHSTCDEDHGSVAPLAPAAVELAAD